MRIRSGFSFRYGYGFLRDLLPRIETPYAPLTDRGSCYGFNQWRKLCAKADKKPIFGFEVAVTSSLNAKETDRAYVTLLALDALGPLNEAFQKATMSSGSEVILSYAQLNNIPEDKVAIMVGRHIRHDQLDPNRKWYFAESPSALPRTRQQSRDLGWIPIASSDNTYPAPADELAWRILLGRDAQNQTWPQHVMGDGELAAYAPPASFVNRDALAQLCVAEMLRPKIVHPEVEETMEEWCERGAAELSIDLNDKVYSNRLQHELKIIHDLGFDDYFFIIADLIRHAKRHMLVGPARGSSCGSIVCYLMGITTVDPIVHDLLFERFIDPNRTDLPDIDIDFSDQHRHLVFAYLAEKYGQARVARLGTIAYLREKSMVNTLGAYLQVPQHKLEPALRSVIRDEGNASNDYLPQYLSKAFETSLEGQRLLKEYPELEIAPRLEGHPLHHSMHAAGAIVTATPVTDYVAVDNRSNIEGNLGTAELDKFDAQDLDILKIDALGLKQLSVFEDCLELLGRPKDWSFLTSLPLDDPAAFKVLNDRKFSGIFQYNGPAVQGVSSSFNVETFEDMVATTSLARPGPMNAGGTAKWIEIRTGRSQVEMPHPLFEPILGRTQGIVIYQEQVMQAGRQIGNMSWPRVTKLRKVVQYFTGKAEMESFREEFLLGSREKGIPDDDANAFWDMMLAYGSYAFNRSHAVAYSMLSYWCCWFKAYHPIEFAAAMLNHENDPERQRIMLREITAEGVEYQPVDPMKSGLKWQAAGGRLVGPLTMVKGLGKKTAERFLIEREATGSLPKRALRLLENPITPLDTLEPVRHAIRKNHPDLTAVNIFSEPNPIGSVGDQELRDKLFMGLVIKAFPKKSKNGGNQMTCILRDDTGEIRFFINDRKYDDLGKKILESGPIGKTLWAVKGSTPAGGGIIWADMVRFLGHMS